MHIHIATGGATITTITAGINYLSGVDKVYLISDKGRSESAKHLKKHLEISGIATEIRKVDGLRDFQGIVETIYSIYQENSENKGIRYTMNITGGTSLMSAAACSAGFFIGAELFYVMYDREKELLEQDPIEERIVPISIPERPDVDSLRDKAKKLLGFIDSIEKENKRRSLMKPPEKPIELTGAYIRENFKNKRGTAYCESRQSLGHHLSNLSKKGLIKIDQSDDDKRYNNISLTSEGRLVAGWIARMNQ